MGALGGFSGDKTIKQNSFQFADGESLFWSSLTRSLNIWPLLTGTIPGHWINLHFRRRSVLWFVSPMDNNYSLSWLRLICLFIYHQMVWNVDCLGNKQNKITDCESNVVTEGDSHNSLPDGALCASCFIGQSETLDKTIAVKSAVLVLLQVLTAVSAGPLFLLLLWHLGEPLAGERQRQHGYRRILSFRRKTDHLEWQEMMDRWALLPIGC